jgi:hypothetical protein
MVSEQARSLTTFARYNSLFEQESSSARTECSKVYLKCIQLNQCWHYLVLTPVLLV